MKNQSNYLQNGLFFICKPSIYAAACCLPSQALRRVLFSFGALQPPVAQALILYICLAVVFGPRYQGKNLGQSARVADAAELCWRHTADLDWRGVAWPFEIR